MPEGGEAPEKKEETHIPRRGDLIRFPGWDRLGLVLGWVDQESFCILELPQKKIFTTEYDEGEVEILMKAEEIKNLEAILPKTIAVEAERPNE